MLALLPLVSLIVLFLIFYQTDKCWRSSILSAVIAWGLLLTAITEILTLGRALTFAWLIVIWGLIDFVLIYIYFKLIKKSKWIGNRKTTKRLSPSSILVLCSVVFIVAAIGLTALIAPPNNWDSMDYHMARVVHWIQNHSVADYPTNYTPQLFVNPWSEFTITHLQILSGGDRFANLVQWLSMVGSIIGVSLISKQLGSDFRGQVLSALVCATIPMGILQASSTQNDYVVSFWLVCFIYYVLVSVKQDRSNTYVFRVGASLGLAILTKQTAYIYAFPFLIWFFIWGIKALSWKIWKSAVTIGFLVLSINIGHYARNLDLFHSPLGDPGWKYTNDVFSLATFISNIIRNIALHIGVPVFHKIIYKIIVIIHFYLGVDLNDPRTTWRVFDVPNGLSFHEDNAANTIHLFLILLTVTIFIFLRKSRIDIHLGIYLLCIISSFLIFCFLLKWTPWHSRLHTPIFVLLSAFVGVILSKILSHKVVKYITIVLILSSFPYVFFNQSRPLISPLFSIKEDRTENIFNTNRIHQYFNNRSELREPYIGAADFLRSKECLNIGFNFETWEYPLWVLLKKDGKQAVRIEDINVKNISLEKSKVYPYKNFIPCAIISVKDTKSQEQATKEIISSDATYVQEWSLDPVSVFIRQ